MQSKKRSENWLEEDKIILKDLIKERVAIIENKNTDSNTNAKKISAWANLHVGFNVMARTPRTLKQLKSQWCLIKMTEKKKKFAQRREIMKTGGGPPPEAPPPVDSNDIQSWLPNEFEIDSNEFDSDNRVIVIEQESQDTVDDINGLFPSSPPAAGPPAGSLVGRMGNSGLDEIFDSGDDPLNSFGIENGPYTQDPLKNDLHTVYQNENNDVNREPTRKTNIKKTKQNRKQINTAEMIAENEIQCRKELHEMQMKNEQMKFENLVLGNEILKYVLTNLKK